MSYLSLSYCIVLLFVPCSLVLTCWERANLLALLCEMFPCVFVTFSCDIMGQEWYLIGFMLAMLSAFVAKSYIFVILDTNHLLCGLQRRRVIHV